MYDAETDPRNSIKIDSITKRTEINLALLSKTLDLTSGKIYPSHLSHFNYLVN